MTMSAVSMKIVRRLLVAFFVVLFAGGAVGYGWMRSGLPDIEGAITLDGLDQPVEVIRDKYGIPHIRAATENDAYFALGYVHGQDRLWQMEFQRRVGAGRLSEFAGETTVAADKFLRTLGVYRAAERAYATLPEADRERLDAYTAGVNAFLANHDGAWPPEFVLLGIEPEPWRPADTLVWLKMMAWDLSGNWGDEILRARLLKAGLTPEQVQDLWPPYPGDSQPPLDDMAWLYRDMSLATVFDGAATPRPDGIGSNNWVVGPQRSETGAPLLANDPHLGLAMPALWYFAHIKAPGLDVIGATLPGVPFVVLGRNDRIAWGFTNTAPDTQDMFVEKLSPDDPDRYLTPQGSAAFDTRIETIKVKDGDDVVITVRETRHGPVISDHHADARDATRDGYVLSFSWTSLAPDDHTLSAGFALNRARNWEEFQRATQNFLGPQQNMVYADVDGNIGLISPAKVPLRRKGDGACRFRAGPVSMTGSASFPGTICPAAATRQRAISTRRMRRSFPTTTPISCPMTGRFPIAPTESGNCWKHGPSTRWSAFTRSRPTSRH